MQFRLPHPWDPGYALPQNVWDEPADGGVMVSHMMPRGTYFRGPVPPPWQPGYAIPGYIKREKVGAPARVTRWAPRGTISQNVPEYLSGLGDVLNARVPGGPGDPFVAFGRKAAAKVMAAAKRLPKSQRMIYLRRVFDAIDPKLWDNVSEKASKYQGVGQPAPKALQSAIAASMANGLLRQVVNLGGARSITRSSGPGPLGATAAPTGAPGSPTNPWDFSFLVVQPTITTHTGKVIPNPSYDPNHPYVAAYRDHTKSANLFYKPQFQVAWNTALSHAGSSDKKGLQGGTIPFARFTNDNDSGKEWGVYWNGSVLQIKPIAPEKKKSWWSRFKSWIRSIGHGIVVAVKAVVHAAAAVVSTVSDLACKALGSSAGKAAAIGGATAMGVPPQAGAAGANIAAGLCGSGGSQSPPVPTKQSGFPILPVVIIGGVGFAAFMLLRK